MLADETVPQKSRFCGQWLHLLIGRKYQLKLERKDGEEWNVSQEFVYESRQRTGYLFSFPFCKFLKLVSSV